MYLRLRDGTGNVVVHLLMAKSRVAPTKRVTLPRLELMAAYLLSKLVQFVLKSLKMNIARYVCWSDSMITLGWIRRPSHSWKTFVANRVQNIQENVAPEHWRFCPGDSNPADLVTRGQSLQNLAHNSLWWHGPDWLCESALTWPSDVSSEESNDLPESKQGPSCNVAFSRLLPSCIQESRIQRWKRLIRITALVFKSVRLFKRGISNAPVDPSNSLEITAEHLDEAKIYWYQEIQKETFPEEWHCLKEKKVIPPKSPLISLSPTFDETFGLIRVGGRLQFADLPEETKHQIILPAKHPVVDKIIAHTHEEEACHAGPETTLAILRQRFWILQGRRTVQRVIHQCLTCRKYRIGPVEQQMAPLPAERVNVAPAFSHVGIDFTGHLVLKMQNASKSSGPCQKAYVCIFSCATTRMVHLELTNDMTTDEFLQAFRRMYNRRGLCNTLWSDNQTTFKKANKDLTWLFEASKQKFDKVWKKIDSSRIQREMATKGIKWKFITERSPHRGGWWERVCRSLKEPLRKILGKALLTYTEMYTVLTDIEAVLNSRPLTFIGNNITDGEIITPAHLALGRSLKEVPDVPKEKINIAPVTSRFLYRQNLLNRFWKRWLAEYLPKLTIRQKWRSEKPPLKEGDVVLISEDNVKRGNWPLGLVQEVHKGSDNLIRTVTLKTKSGIRRRSVQKLYLLEESQLNSEPSSKALKSGNVQSKEENSHVVSAQDQINLDVNCNLDTMCQGGENVRVSRYGRKIKPPDYLHDL